MHPCTNDKVSFTLSIYDFEPIGEKAPIRTMITSHVLKLLNFCVRKRGASGNGSILLDTYRNDSAFNGRTVAKGGEALG